MRGKAFREDLFAAAQRRRRLCILKLDLGIGREMGRMRHGVSSRFRDIVLYGGVAACAVLLAVMLLQFAGHLTSLPITYSDDGIGYLVSAKGIVENGQLYTNPHLGAPGVAQFFDWPSADGLFTLELWLLSRFTANYVAVLNLFALLTYPLVALASAWAMRRLGLTRASAFVFSILYSFIVFHQSRLTSHLYLSAYFVVPLTIALIATAVLGARDDGDGLAAAGDTRRAWALGVPRWGWPIAVALGACGVYYAFFGIVLAVVGGLVAWLEARDYRRLIPAAAIVAVVLATITIQFAPSYVYWHREGSNNVASGRVPWASDLFALRVTQLVFPRLDHRIPRFAEFKASYRDSLTAIGPNLRNIAYDSSLGIVGTAGFFLLLVWALASPLRAPPKRPRGMPAKLTLLNVCALLLATVGGLGSVLAYVAFPQIRAYDRITPFIAFFSLCAVAWAADVLVGRLTLRLPPGRPVTRYGATVLVLVAVLAVGLWDETSPADTPPFSAIGAQFYTDRAFVGAVEGVLPPGASVLQLPYVPFPDGAGVNRTGPYDQLRLYLHSHSLRWSAGAFAGRPDAVWQEQAASLPPAQMVTAVRSRGFSGIAIDRFGYADSAAALETALEASAGVGRALVSSDGRYVFYPLPE
jgi:hypothetical protein